MLNIWLKSKPAAQQLLAKPIVRLKELQITCAIICRGHDRDALIILVLADTLGAIEIAIDLARLVHGWVPFLKIPNLQQKGMLCTSRNITTLR